MIASFIVVGIIYLGVLVILVRKTRVKDKTTENYLLAGGSIGFVLGLFTTAATLFSAFTVVGMPDFFRTHGVGAWIFLAVSDTIMIYALLRIGSKVREKARALNYQGMAGLMSRVYQSRLAGYVALAGAVTFLIPYIAVQISGISIFLNAAFPQALPVWAWSTLIVGIMIIYSETGGLRAIMYNDTLQGLLLFAVIWIIGVNCLHQLGGVRSMFEQVEQINESLLSSPGPKGLFTPQFLIISAIAITFIPFTQPQVSSRMILMKDEKSLRKMAVGLGIFAILVILPTMFMGMYGAVLYAESSTQEFIGHVLLYDQLPLIAALGLIGLIAAAISTSDSQIFALGSELRSLLTIEESKALRITRIFILVFGVVALIFSIISSEHLVLLARTSFAGTALMGPMIIVGLFKKGRLTQLMPLTTLISLVIFILSKAGVLPGEIGPFDMEIPLITGLLIFSIIEARNK